MPVTGMTWDELAQREQLIQGEAMKRSHVGMSGADILQEEVEQGRRRPVH